MRRFQAPPTSTIGKQSGVLGVNRPLRPARARSLRAPGDMIDDGSVGEPGPGWPVARRSRAALGTPVTTRYRHPDHGT